MTFSKTGTPDPEWNWARTHQFAATKIEMPGSIDELVALIAAAVDHEQGVRCIGSRHSFTDIADGDVLIDLAQLPEQFRIDPARSSVTVNGAMTYARLAILLGESDLAIANMASLPHISVAGAVATGTHGSGTRNGGLATAVRALDIVTSSGDLRRIERGEADFNGAVVSLGALGAIVTIELDVQPAFDMAQEVHENVPWDRLTAGFAAIFASTYSVSAFTNWIDPPHLWTKRRLGDPVPNHATLHDGLPALSAHHPVPGENASGCTEQFGRAGSWADRLPHFRASHQPSVGAEVQSEFFVAHEDAAAVLTAMRGIGPDLASNLMVSELRTVASDELWLSPSYRRDSFALHFTWHHDLAAATNAAHLVAATLEPFAPRPHWGKVFVPADHGFDSLYPRLGDARQLFTDWDPTSTFRNDWLRRNIF